VVVILLDVVILSEVKWMLKKSVRKTQATCWCDDTKKCDETGQEIERADEETRVDGHGMSTCCNR